MNLLLKNFEVLKLKINGKKSLLDDMINEHYPQICSTLQSSKLHARADDNENHHGQSVYTCTEAEPSVRIAIQGEGMGP